MNNNFFAIVRYMRDRGIDAELILFDDEFSHFRPDADAFTLDYRHYTRAVDWGSRPSFDRTPASVIKSDLAPYDRLFGTGLAPAFVEKSGRRLDVFKVYGYDVRVEPRYHLLNRHPIRYNRVSRHQRQGIVNSRFVCMARQNPTYESHASTFLRNVPRLFRPIPLVYAPEYSAVQLAKYRDRLHLGWFLDQLRQSCGFLAISHSRQSWTMSRSDVSNKGSDRVITAWSRFVHENASLNPKLVLFEYGRDVLASKRLISELAIDDSVEWLPPSARKEIMYGLHLSDVSLGPSSDLSWNTGGTHFETLVSKTPMICHRNDALHVDDDLPLYPVLNARTSDEIHHQLIRLSANPEMGKSYGEQGCVWYQEHVVKPKIDEYLQCLST